MLKGVDLDLPAGRSPGGHRRLRHRQVGADQVRARPDDPRQRVDPHRRRRGGGCFARYHGRDAPQVRHAVPGRRPVRQPAGLGERGLRPARRQAGRPGARHGQGRGDPGHGRPRPRGRPADAGRAVGRDAEARRPRPRHRPRARDPVLRRADHRPRPDHGRRHQRADRALRAPAGRHGPVDHPRHGERAQDRRSRGHAATTAGSSGRARPSGSTPAATRTSTSSSTAAPRARSRSVRPRSGPDGQAAARLRLPELRCRTSALGRPLRRLRRLEQPGRGSGGEPGAGRGRQGSGRRLELVPLKGSTIPPPRLPSGIDELDRVLGGGIVAGARHPDRRRPRHRQEHADAAGGRRPGRPGP